MNINDLYSILLSDKPSINIKDNEEELFKFIPELEKCKGFNQNNDWHIYDVYEHILHVVDYVDNDIILRLAALFHDVGKPLAYVEDLNGVGHFYGHWTKSQDIFDLFALTHNIDDNISFMVSNLILYHDKNIGKLNNYDLNGLYKLFGYNGIELLFKLKEADLLAQNSKYHSLLNDYSDQKRKIFTRCR